MVAGETLAFLYELALCDTHSDVSMFESDTLIELLRTLANDSSKHRSKKDKKQQRVCFRDVLKTIGEGDSPEAQTIKFGRAESLYLDNWVRRKQYDTLRELLGTGMNAHLQENEFVREMFDLGAPVPSSAAAAANTAAMSRIEKAHFNKEQFRNRTKTMNRKRENKESAAGRSEMDED